MPSRLDSARLVPGGAVIVTVAVPSWKGGRKLVPRAGTLAAATSTSAAVTPITGAGRGSERAGVRRLQLPHDPAVAAVVRVRAAPQQVRGEHRGDGQRHDHRGQDRHDVRHPEGGEQPSLDPREREQRKEHENHEHGGVHDGAAHLEARVQDDPQGGAWLGRRGVPAQPAVDVLHVHDRVVDELPDRHRQPAEGHRVQRQAEGLQRQRRHDE